MIYFILLSSFVLFSFSEVMGLKKITRKAALLMLVALLIVFVGFRFNTGRDYPTYIAFFNKSLSPRLSENWEPGYVLLNKIIKTIFNNYYVLQFSASLFICAAAYWLFTKYSVYPIASFTIFISYFMTTILMAQVRQSIALGIVILSTRFIFSKQYLLFIGMIVLACMFHVSAFIAFPLCFLQRRYRKGLLIFLILCAQLIYFKPEILIDAMLSAASVIPGRVSTLIVHYLHSELARSGEFSTGLYYLGELVIAIVLVASADLKNETTRFLMNALTVFILLKAVSGAVFILYRFQAYYVVFAMCAYTLLFKTINFRKMMSLYPIYALCVILFFALRLVRLLSYTASDNGALYHDFVPYKNVLSWVMGL